jgi:hypothetical protein
MVKSAALVAAIVMLMAAVDAMAATPAASKVIAMSITRNGARSNAVSGDETAAQCSRFKLTPRDVHEFFAKAVRASVREYTHDLEMSRCYAEGTIAFANGVKGRWFIDLERRGELVLPGARSDANSIFYYCKRCAAPPFDDVYDPDKE